MRDEHTHRQSLFGEYSAHHHHFVPSPSLRYFVSLLSPSSFCCRSSERKKKRRSDRVRERRGRQSSSAPLSHSLARSQSNPTREREIPATSRRRRPTSHAITDHCHGWNIAGSSCQRHVRPTESGVRGCASARARDQTGTTGDGAQSPVASCGDGAHAADPDGTGGHSPSRLPRVRPRGGATAA